VRDVLDPQSPYKDSYAPWDIWLGQHGLRPGDKLVDAYYRGEAPSGFARFSVMTDEQGFIVPAVELLRQQIAQQTSLKDYLSAPHCVHLFEAAGVPDPGLLEGMEQAKGELWASLLPPVPAALAQKPPQLTILLPGGEAVCFGKVPAAAGQEPLTQATYYRLGADGRLLGFVAPGLPWQELYCQDYAARILLAASAKDCVSVSLNGYTIWLQEESREPTAIFDYDGTPLPLDTDTARREGGLIMQLYSDMLVEVHKAQQVAAGGGNGILELIGR
jgi:hypothetical protein